MAEGSVTVPPDSTGKVLRMITNVGVASGALQEVVTIGNASGILVDPLTDVQRLAAAGPVKDDYQTGEVLADQTGAAGVLIFTFAAAVQLVVVHAVGSLLVGRADPFGGTPSATLGIRCPDDVPTYMPVTATVVKVYAPSGLVVSVWGYRRS